ncbi:MAG: NUDIX hydrolase, partial [Acidimicrobiia bacterium]
PEVIDRLIAPALALWAGSEVARQNRTEVTFGMAGAPWDEERVLERYELLYETGLIAEAGTGDGLGEPMAADHRRIAATALGRLRGKLKYRPVVFELLPPTFTLFQLQRVVEALAGVRLHKQNFRRLLERGGLVEGTGELEAGTGGRPAELFRFRREVLRERPAPGVGLPRG